VPGPSRVVIVGATGTGKTALALDMARAEPDHYELVSVDAIAVYRHLDLGTAKPTRAEQLVAPWHLIDIVDPSQQFSVAAFQAEARIVLSGIEARDHVPLLVGGTGLYHRAVVDALEIPARFPVVAEDLERQAELPGGLAELFARLCELDPRAAQRIEPANRRRIVRALEVTLGTGRPFSSFGPGLLNYAPTSSIIIGLELERPELDRRLAERFERQLASGFLDEVRALSTRPEGLSRTARQAIGYRELLSHVEQGVPLERARAEALQRLRALARRQEAWFKRDPRVVWVRADRDDLFDAVRGVLEHAAVAGAVRH
jgi:tRNA dimethylallyltransferase